MTFIAQYNCREMCVGDVYGLFPSAGMLYLFAYGPQSDQVQTEGKILHYPGDLSLLKKFSSDAIPGGTTLEHSGAVIPFTLLEDFRPGPSEVLGKFTQEEWVEEAISSVDEWACLFAGGCDELGSAQAVGFVMIKWQDLRQQNWDSALFFYNDH